MSEPMFLDADSPGIAQGANNRLDVVALCTSAGGEESPDEVEGAGEEEHDNGEVVRHTRGLAPYVFVHSELAARHELNLDVETMDFYVPG